MARERRYGHLKEMSSLGVAEERHIVLLLVFELVTGLSVDRGKIVVENCCKCSFAFTTAVMHYLIMYCITTNTDQWW